MCLHTQQGRVAEIVIQIVDHKYYLQRFSLSLLAMDSSMKDRCCFPAQMSSAMCVDVQLRTWWRAQEHNKNHFIVECCGNFFLWILIDILLCVLCLYNLHPILWTLNFSLELCWWLGLKWNVEICLWIWSVANADRTQYGISHCIITNIILLVKFMTVVGYLCGELYIYEFAVKLCKQWLFEELWFQRLFELFGSWTMP